ncbi:hypothetical protein [Microbacterium sp. GXS0129]|uniref:hypothetical protein n=1 Tax=Microbacterium sp. GXS0129 TaxID=3377836 RepID=UPI00383AC01A
MQRTIMADTGALGSLRAQLVEVLEPCAAISVPDATGVGSDLVSSASSFFVGEWERVLTAVVTDGERMAAGLVATVRDFTATERDAISSVSALVQALEE